MNGRDDMFRRRFENAAALLNVKPHEATSLKFRATGPAVAYQRFCDLLRQSPGITLSTVSTDVCEHGMVGTLGEGKAMAVEHETGMELLNAAGSVASLIALIPLIVWCWRKAGEFRHRYLPDEERLEIRWLDESGQLHEDVEAVYPIWSLLASVTVAMSDDLKSIKERLIAFETRLKSPEESRSLPSGQQPLEKTGCPASGDLDSQFLRGDARAGVSGSSCIAA